MSIVLDTSLRTNVPSNLQQVVCTKKIFCAIFFMIIQIYQTKIVKSALKCLIQSALNSRHVPLSLNPGINHA